MVSVQGDSVSGECTGGYCEYTGDGVSGECTGG